MTTKTATVLTPPATRTGVQGTATITLPNIHKTPQMVEVERANDNRDIRLILLEDYNALGSQVALALKYKVTQQTIQYWFEKLGIVIETVSTAKLTALPVAE